jgi:hypothetical protein
LDFGLRENVRAAEKLTAFLELESAIRGSAFAIDKQTRLFADWASLKRI